jgi:periplasmic divalent cation tolerance protein
MSDKKIVLTTSGSQDEARKIARSLVERRLAACVNIVPQIESIYRWQGNVDQALEWLLIIKTTAGAFEKVSCAIRELHSYELPECICLDIEDGTLAYFNWIAEAVGQNPG